MAEIVGAVVIITTLVIFQLYMFLIDVIDSGAKIMMGLTIFFTVIIVQLINFLLNFNPIGI